MTTEQQTSPQEMAPPSEQGSEQALHGPDREMPCPVCGHPMPNLKGGKDSICPVCGFKDSCCY
jgi:hypothetical protein